MSLLYQGKRTGTLKAYKWMMVEVDDGLDAASRLGGGVARTVGLSAERERERDRERIQQEE